MPKWKKAKTSKLKSNVRGERLSTWVPPSVKKALERYAFDEGCSLSWAMTEAICDFLGLDEEQIAVERGFAIPKKIDDRKNNPEWSPNTTASRNKAKRKSNKSKDEEYFEKAAKEEGARRPDEFPTVVHKSCKTPGCRATVTLVQGNIDADYWERGLCVGCSGE